MSVSLSDVRGLARLATTGTLRVTEIVETMHAEILRAPRVGHRPAPLRARGLTGFVYGLVRGITSLAGHVADVPLGWLAAARDGASPLDAADATSFHAVLNGLVGDHLHETGNPLAMPLSIRGAAPVPPDATRLVVLVHGLCHDERAWRRGGAGRPDYGARLARDLGVVPLYVRYNSGLNVSTNGRALSRALEEFVAAWPVPVEELALVGYSMGGLVARSACHEAAVTGAAWARPLRTVVCVGTPHHGAPLERLGNQFETLLLALPYAAGLGRIGRLRSAGITDLRHGNVLDEHWQDRDRFECGPRAEGRAPVRLPDGVVGHAIAGTRGRTRGDVRDVALGDGLVPVESALGEHVDGDMEFAGPETRFVACATGHLDLLDSDVVYERIRTALEERATAR